MRESEIDELIAKGEKLAAALSVQSYLELPEKLKGLDDLLGQILDQTQKNRFSTNYLDNNVRRLKETADQLKHDLESEIRGLWMMARLALAIAFMGIGLWLVQSYL